MSDTETCDAAVVGGGPAGLGAAVALREAGVENVVVLEREQLSGGAPRHCGSSPFLAPEMPWAMLGPDFARHITRRAVAAGVDLRIGHTVTGIEPGGLLRLATPRGKADLRARRVILATGARETPRSVRLVSGTRPLGVMNTGALQQMLYLKGLVPFRRPLIVGTELVSYSAVLTCLRHGIRPVAVIDGGEGSPVPEIFALFPRSLGVPVRRGCELVEILGADVVEGARLRVGDTQWVQDCDGIVFTGGFRPDAALVRDSSLAFDRLSGGPLVDQFGRCSDPAYFAAGNLLRALETGGFVRAEGAAVGRFVAADLANGEGDAGGIEIACGPGVRYAVPRRLTLPLRPGLGRLRIEVDRAVKGVLTITADGRPIWSKRVSSPPGARHRVPIDELRVPEGTAVLSVDLRDAGG